MKITNGTAGSRQVFWTCTQGPCHTGCGFKSIGVITIGSDGKGKFKFKGAAPFLERYTSIYVQALLHAQVEITIQENLLLLQMS